MMSIAIAELESMPIPFEWSSIPEQQRPCYRPQTPPDREKLRIHHSLSMEATYWIVGTAATKHAPSP
jgi:hypothetical protein